MHQSRRDFLRLAAATPLGFAGLQMLMARRGFASPRAQDIAYGYGPLLPDPAGLLELPEGFHYEIISRFKDPMDDGLRVPGQPDGMAAFAGKGGRVILVRNHELDMSEYPDRGGFGDHNEHRDLLDHSAFYDPGPPGPPPAPPCTGGTTTLVYNPAAPPGERIEAQFMSLAGTSRNCAGGPTPWGSWLTCEEAVYSPDELHAKPHGYVFEVPATSERKLAEPVALRAMGRFLHEAVAVDPVSGVVYLTEDRNDGLLYRYIPEKPGELRAGGYLQALAALDFDRLDTRGWDPDLPKIPVGTRMRARWIDLDDVDPADDSLRLRGADAGAASFARGEGMWYGALRGAPAIYFACTSGGQAGKGQIWKYTPSPREGAEGEAANPGVLELFVEPNDGSLIENADNLTVAPWGDLILCEDGSGEDYLVGVTARGEIYKFARNVANTSELAGAVFSPDGLTLFVNIQSLGLTLAITGPWRSR